MNRRRLYVLAAVWALLAFVASPSWPEVMIVACWTVLALHRYGRASERLESAALACLLMTYLLLGSTGALDGSAWDLAIALFMAAAAGAWITVTLTERDIRRVPR